MNISGLGLTGCLSVLDQLTHDYCRFSEFSSAKSDIPNSLHYRVTADAEPRSVSRTARVAALKSFFTSPLKKIAFDTRRINQETDRNPRENLQYWSRSDQFIDDELQNRINILARLLPPVEELKNSYGTQPEWHGSYTRVLHDALNRILRIKEADLDVSRSQVAYLEQLLFARYRLSMDELSKISSEEFKNALLKKDEGLSKKGAYQEILGLRKEPAVIQASSEPQTILIKNQDANNTQQNIINAIFGNKDLRRVGEKTVERTVTITIRDQLVE